MCIGLYASVPFLILIRKEYGESFFLILGISLLVLAIPTAYFSKIYWPFQFMLYLGYFILGHALPKIKYKKLQNHVYLLIYLGFSLAAGLTNALIPVFKEKSILDTYLSPTTILASLSLFIYFNNIKQPSFNWSKLAKYSLNFYVLHAFVLSLYNRCISSSEWCKGDLYIPTAFFVVSILTYLILFIGANSLLNKTFKVISIRLQ